MEATTQINETESEDYTPIPFNLEEKFIGRKNMEDDHKFSPRLIEEPMIGSSGNFPLPKLNFSTSLLDR